MVAQRYKEDHEWIKEQIQNSFDYFSSNYKMFNESCNFVFNTAIGQQEATILEDLRKPNLEFNISEAYVSRQLGEFAKQEPSIYVSPSDGAEVDPKTIELLQNHIKYLLDEANKQNCAYRTYRDEIAGGFSGLEQWTEYANPRSFNQVFKVGKVFDPTLCGWDPLSEQPHKCDGRYAFKQYPMAFSEFKAKYKKYSEKDFSFIRMPDNNFNWSYRNQHEQIVMLCEFWKKKTEEVKIVNVVGKGTMDWDDYKALLDNWNTSNQMAQAPQIIGKPRMTEIIKICRYRVIENDVLEYEETDYEELPLIFVDGNSMQLRNHTSGESRLHTKPYAYNLKGIQKLQNFAGQTLGYVLENMVTHKFKVAVESLPDQKEWRDAYTNIQRAMVLMYKSLNPNNPDQPLPPPSEITPVPAPPEIMQTFQYCAQMSQNIIGSYDASLGINKNELSGIAMIEGATQSNATAMPFIVGYLQALEQLGNSWIKSIPTYYNQERSIPIIDQKGNKQFVKINSRDGSGHQMNYDKNSLQVKVEPGINFSVQKNRNLQTLATIAQAFPIFAEFMASKGLMVLIDNLEIKGSEQLKPLAESFQLELKQQKEAQKKMPNPAMAKIQLEQKKLQANITQDNIENHLKMQQMQNDKAELEETKRGTDNDTIRILADMQESKENAEIQHDRGATERFSHLTDIAMKGMDMDKKHHLATKDQLHRHAKETIELHHKLTNENQKEKKEEKNEK